MIYISAPYILSKVNFEKWYVWNIQFIVNRNSHFRDQHTAVLRTWGFLVSSTNNSYLNIYSCHKQEIYTNHAAFATVVRFWVFYTKFEHKSYRTLRYDELVFWVRPESYNADASTYILHYNQRSFQPLNVLDELILDSNSSGLRPWRQFNFCYSLEWAALQYQVEIV